MVEGAWVWGVRGGEWSVMSGDDGGGKDGCERIEVVVWHRERLDVHGEVGELSVKRGDVGGKEEVVERSEEEVECEGEFLVVCVGELRVMRGGIPQEGSIVVINEGIPGALFSVLTLKKGECPMFLSVQKPS